MKPPILHNDRLELRPLNLSFCTQKYVDWMNDPEVYKYLETRGDYTIDKLRDYLSDVEEKNILSTSSSVKIAKISFLRNFDLSLDNQIINPDLSFKSIGGIR